MTNPTEIIIVMFICSILMLTSIKITSKVNDVKNIINEIGVEYYGKGI